MSRKIVIAVAFAMVGAWTYGQTASAQSKQAPQNQARETLKQLTLDLKEAKGLAAGIPDKNLRSRMDGLVSRMEGRCEELRKQMNAIRPPVYPPMPAAIVPVNEADFEKFHANLKSQSFDDGKLKALKGFVPHVFLTCEQGKRLVKSFSFGDGQSQAAILIHSKVVDPVNFYEVLAALTFESDRAKVRKAVGIE